MDVLSFAKLLPCPSFFLLSLCVCVGGGGANTALTHLHIPDVVLTKEEIGTCHDVRTEHYIPT